MFEEIKNANTQLDALILPDAIQAMYDSPKTMLIVLFIFFYKLRI